MDTYKPGTTDTLGKRIAHLRDKLSEWCGDANLAKMCKGLKKRTSICCGNLKMPTMVGCDSSSYYGKIKKKYNKKTHYKKRCFIKSADDSGVANMFSNGASSGVAKGLTSSLMPETFP